MAQAQAKADFYGLQSRPAYTTNAIPISDFNKSIISQAGMTGKGFPMNTMIPFAPTPSNSGMDPVRAQEARKRDDT